MKRKIRSTPVDPAVSAAAKALGAKGGRNARGDKKRQPPEHYDKLAEARRTARTRRQLGGE